MRLSSPRRRGAHLVETALIFSLVILLLAGMGVGAMGIFNYQEMAFLSREAARYASTHGGQYQQENAAAITANTLPNVTDDYVTKNIVQARAVSLDTSQLTTTITFNMSGGSYDWDDTTDNGQRWPSSAKTVSGTTYNETNTVSVTLTYQWYPVWFFSGHVPLTSTSVMPMCY
jgi:hypothetical protein